MGLSRKKGIVSRITHAGERNEPGRPFRDGRWWNELDREFAWKDERFELGPNDRVQIQGTAAADVVLRTLGASLIAGLALPSGYHPLAVWRALGDRKFYADLAEKGDPREVFAEPPAHVSISRRRARLPLFRPDDGSCDDLRFESPFVPLNPRERKPYLAHRSNRIAHARHWRHRGAPRPTIIAVHGFSADFYHLNEWFFAIPWLYAHGYDVLLLTMPFHGARRGPLSPFSGHGFFAGGVSRINEAFAQAVFDLRLYLNALLAEGVPRVGVMGVSLGGLVAGLAASVEPRLAFALPNVPAVSLADLMMEWEPVSTFVRAAFAATGRSIVELRQWLAPTCPLTYPPVLARERLMIIGGAGDRLVPPKHPRILWEHWGRCRMHWYPGSHLIHLDRGEYLEETRKFFAEIAF